MATGPARDAQQSAYSDPGRFAFLFDDVDATIEGASQAARNVIVHYQAHASVLPASTRTDIDLRWMERILQTDQRRHAYPLLVERDLASRVQGCCRDHSVFAAAVLRHHGIPARTRVGFADYLAAGWHADHVVVEAWIDGGWRRFDPELDPVSMPSTSSETFVTAAQAWCDHRRDGRDLQRFGSREHPSLRGVPFVAAKVVTELAHRYQHELLLWDRWGPMDPYRFDGPIADASLVDEIAARLVDADGNGVTDEASDGALFAAFTSDDRLHPGRTLHTISPTGAHYLVDLATRTSTSEIPPP